MQQNKVLYAELLPEEFRQIIKERPVAYLPLGTIEWHGEHLPLGADGIQSGGFFEELARRVGGIVFPMLFMGPDRVIHEDGRELIGMDYCSNGEGTRYTSRILPGSCYFMEEEAFGILLDSIIRQMHRAGFRVVVAHGHGPSTGYFMKQTPRWQEEYGMKFLCCWSSEAGEGRGIQVDHAAMNETSLTMALRPDLVQINRLPADLSVWPDGMAGRDPRVYASAQLGREIIDENLDRMEKRVRDELDAAKAK